MLLLALDTSTSHSSVALCDRAKPLATASLGLPRRHGEYLAPAIRFCLSQADRAAADITGVVVGRGPGLYTGLRVGLITARTFAATRRLPLVGVSGLDVLAHQARHADRTIAAVIDARRREVFWALYAPVPGGMTRLTEPAVGPASHVANEIAGRGGSVLAVGDGALEWSDTLVDAGAEIGDVDLAAPKAEHMAALSVARFEREETQRPDEVTPLYLRDADARIGWEQRGRLRGGAA